MVYVCVCVCVCVFVCVYVCVCVHVHVCVIHYIYSSQVIAVIYCAFHLLSATYMYSTFLMGVAFY